MLKQLSRVIVGVHAAAIVALSYGMYDLYDQQADYKRQTHYAKLENQKKIRVIAVYIKHVNSDVSIAKAREFATTIVNVSAKRGINPFVQTALLRTESTFFTNPRHSIAGVKGMGGVYWKWWKKDLKKEDIAETICDLEDPIINIRASAYILAEYKKLYKDKALAHYKGYSPLGRSQAQKVKLVAKQLEKMYYNA